MSDTPHDPEGVEELAAVAGDLKGSIDALNKSFDVLSGKTTTNRRVIYTIGTLSVLKVATIIVLIVVIANMAHTNHRLQTSIRQTNATEQELRSVQSRALCPLYVLFIGAIEHPPPGQAPVPASTVKTINDGYAALKCQ